MLQLTFKSRDEERIYNARTAVHESFVGWEAYIDNTVLIAPINDNGQGEYSFPVIIGPDGYSIAEYVVDLDAEDNVLDGGGERIVKDRKVLEVNLHRKIDYTNSEEESVPL